MTALSCDDFDREVTDLALGHSNEPRRSELLDHAATCPRCDQRFADLVTIGDRMLELAAEFDPPPGFEARTVARMAPTNPRRSLHRLVLAGTAAVLVAVIALWSALGDGPPDGGRHESVAAPILSSDGDRLGTAEIDGTVAPRLIVTIDGPSHWYGTWTCEVRTDGTWVEVGRWKADEVTNGVWAAGLPPPLAEPSAMRILGDSGAVIATADLTVAAEG